MLISVDFPAPFSPQAVHLAEADGQRDVVIRKDPGELLGDAD